MKKILLIGLFVSMLFIPDVYAHPGRTDSDGCHTCKTNCSKWGLEDGEYHCHNGNTYTNKKGQTFNSDGTEIIDANNNSNSKNESDVSNNNSDVINDITNNNSSNNTTSSNSNTNKNEPSKNENKKSSDNTIKTITIDGESYNSFDNIVHVTSSENVNIEVTTNNDKATYDIKNIEPLVFGDNYISIVVTAENGLTKTYNIIVNKERELSSETGIEVIINDEKVVFKQYEATINVDSSITKLDIDYTLKDEKASVEMNEIGELESGDNILMIKVIAENGIQQEYKITIYKYSKTEDIIYTTIGLGVLGGSGYGIYKIAKKKKITKIS